MRDHKRFLAPGDLWDTGTIEAWLEEKAAQGWILEKWGGFARFERMDPRTCRVRLDPQGQRTRSQQEEAEALYAEMGWRPACPLGSYQVYYCFDPAAPDLYTDPATQAWAWGKLVRRTARWTALAVLLWAVWAALQFDDLWKGQIVERLLMGMWAIWLFVIWFAGQQIWQLARQLLGIRRQRNRLEAGVPLERGDPARAVRRQRRREIVSWTCIGLLAVFVAALAMGQRERDLTEVPEPLPDICLEALAPEEAARPMDWAQYEEFRSPLMMTRHQVTEWQWSGPHLETTLAQVRFEPLAELLYQEWLREARDQWPEASVTERQDDRFDQVILLDNGTGRDGRANQILIARRDGAVLRQIVQLRGDLTDHLDDYAAVLAAFQ